MVYAIDHNYTDVVEYLADHYYDNYHIYDGIMIRFISNNNFDSFKYFFEKYKHPFENNTLLYIAAKFNDLDTIKFLFENLEYSEKEIQEALVVAAERAILI